MPAIPSGSGCTLNSYVLRPKSRGSVTLRSADPAEAPIVDPNFVADPDDLRAAAEGVRISREIMNQPALGKYIKREHFPGKDVKTQADFEAYARAFGRTSYHPTGTCKMGSDDLAVVDPQLRVRGLDGIRICDSSIMPSLVGSNTNAATIMIGEKASETDPRQSLGTDPTRCFSLTKGGQSYASQFNPIQAPTRRQPCRRCGNWWRSACRCAPCRRSTE